MKELLLEDNFRRDVYYRSLFKRNVIEFSMALTDFQKTWVKSLLGKLNKKAISQPFKSIESQKSNKIKDLIKIGSNLQENKYDSILEFISDVRELFYQFQYSETKDQFIPILATSLSKWFEEKILKYPRTPQEQWLIKAEKLQKKTRKLIEKGKQILN
jgi:hypothetical protein